MDDVPRSLEREHDEFTDCTVLAGTQNAEMAGLGSTKIYWEMARGQGNKKITDHKGLKSWNILEVNGELPTSVKTGEDLSDICLDHLSGFHVESKAKGSGGNETNSKSTGEIQANGERGLTL